MNSLSPLFRRSGEAPYFSFFSCFSLLLLVSQGTWAFEKWERPLGWHPQYGPRYVVYWGGSAGSKEPSLGTCTYSHYAVRLDDTTTPQSPFEDYILASFYEDSLLNGSPPPAQDEQQVLLTQLPFYEPLPTARGLRLKVPVGAWSRVLRALETIALELCLEFLRRLGEVKEQPSAVVAAKLETEGARLLVLLLEIFNLINRERELSSEDLSAMMSDKLELFSKNLKAQTNWDSEKYIYWLEVSSQVTEEGLPYYIPELEASTWLSSLSVLSLSSAAQDGPYSRILGLSPSPFLDCEHFISSQASLNLAGKEALCIDSFFAGTMALRGAAAQIIAISSERGAPLIEQAAARLRRAAMPTARNITPESPFYPIAAQLLESAATAE